MPNNEFIFILSPSGFAELNGTQPSPKPSLLNNPSCIRWHTKINEIPHRAPKEKPTPKASIC